MRSVTSASAAMVHAPVAGLNAGPSAGRPATGKKDTYRTAPETSSAPARFTRWRIGGRWIEMRRRGTARLAGASSFSVRAGDSTAGSRVTDGSLLLRFLFRRLFSAAAGKLRHHRRVGEGGRVTERPVLRHVT